MAAALQLLRARRSVAIEDAAIRRIEGEADVLLEDDRILRFSGLFVATTVSPASPLAEGYGCDMAATPMGTTIRTDPSKQTSIPGIYACGDVASLPHSVSLAVGDGIVVGRLAGRNRPGRPGRANLLGHGLAINQSTRRTRSRRHAALVADRSGSSHLSFLLGGG